MEINSDSERAQLIETLQGLKQNGFVVEKEYKKLSKLSKQYPSYATINNNLYHIKTL